jgi:hypothetical protein
MSTNALFWLVAAIGMSAIVQIFTDQRITPQFIARSLVAVAVYAVHVAMAIVVMVYLVPPGDAGALGATAALVGWIGLGVLGLIRFAPRLREPPAWLMRFGIADGACLALIAGGLASAAGLV